MLCALMCMQSLLINLIKSENWHYPFLSYALWRDTGNIVRAQLSFAELQIPCMFPVISTSVLKEIRKEETYRAIGIKSF